MSTYALIHGAGDSGWYWHLVEAELRARGHHTVAPDLPADDDEATFSDYADVVVAALGDAGETDGDVIVVGQSFGAFTAPLVARPGPGLGTRARGGHGAASGRDAGRLVGEDRVRRGGCGAGRPRRRADRSRGTSRRLLPGRSRAARQASARARAAHPSTAAGAQPWPLDRWPDVHTRFVLCTEDRLFPCDVHAAGSSSTGWASYPTSSPAVTAPHSATPRSWRSCSSATRSADPAALPGVDASHHCWLIPGAGDPNVASVT